MAGRIGRTNRGSAPQSAQVLASQDSTAKPVADVRDRLDVVPKEAQLPPQRSNVAVERFFPNRVVARTDGLRDPPPGIRVIGTRREKLENAECDRIKLDDLPTQFHAIGGRADRPIQRAPLPRPPTFTPSRRSLGNLQHIGFSGSINHGSDVPLARKYTRAARWERDTGQTEASGREIYQQPETRRGKQPH